MRFIDRRRLREKHAVARKLRQESTPEEKLLWRHLRTNKLHGYHFRRQHVLAGFVVDFYCPSARLILELDGAHHGAQIEADLARQAVLEGLGNGVLRFNNSTVRKNLSGVLVTIEAELRKRASGKFPLPRSGEGGQGVRPIR